MLVKVTRENVKIIKNVCKHLKEAKTKETSLTLKIELKRTELTI